MAGTHLGYVSNSHELRDFPGSQGLGDIPIVKAEPPVVSARLTDVPQAPGPGNQLRIPPILYKL
jgi:hypothetical protein